MLALGLASYLSLYPCLLLPPLLILCFDRRARDGNGKFSALTFTSTHILVFLASLAWLLYISSAIIGGSWEFVASTYGVQLLVPDLTPNVGLWWYFFIEMFDSFREFFLGVFWLHVGSYVGGLCLRLRKQPLFVITTLLGIFAIFKPYPSVSDTSLYVALLPLYRHIYPCECDIDLAMSAVLTCRSDALPLFRDSHDFIRLLARTSLLPFVDICWIGQCQFLLCHHFGVESWSHCDFDRLNVRCPA